MTIDEFLAIDKFICEANNYENVYYEYQMPHFNPLTGQEIKGDYFPRFLIEAKWTCNTDHMISKWREAQNRTDSVGWFAIFYCEMDYANKEAMVDWILTNREKGYVDAAYLK